MGFKPAIDSYCPFTTNKIRMDVVALLVIVAFVLSGTLPSLNEATVGFSDPNVLLIAALFCYWGRISKNRCGISNGEIG